MYRQYDYTDLIHEGYTGTAWNVYYEFSDEYDVWGHSGEFADELDAWFKDRDEAIEFADECYGDDVLMEKLEESPDATGAQSITLTIESAEWEDGAIAFAGDETLFVSYEKSDGGIEQVETYR